MTLYGEEIFGVHGTEARDAAEVVAQQIDDHDVLAAVFGIALKPGGDFQIFFCSAAARSGAFHGARDDAAGFSGIVDAKEKLGRKRENVAARLPVKECAVIDWLARAEAHVMRSDAARRPTFELDAKRRGEVELVYVARANPLVNGGDVAGVIGFGEGEFGGELGRWLGRKRRICIPCFGEEVRQFRRRAAYKCACRVVEGVAALVDAEPGEGLIGTAWIRGGLRLKTIAALVGEETRGAVAGGNGVFNVAEERRDFGGRVCGELAERRKEQLGPGFFLGFGTVWWTAVVLGSAFKEHSGRRALNERVDLSGKRVPANHAGSMTERLFTRPELSSNY